MAEFEKVAIAWHGKVPTGIKLHTATWDMILNYKMWSFTYKALSFAFSSVSSDFMFCHKSKPFVQLHGLVHRF